MLQRIQSDERSPIPVAASSFIGRRTMGAVMESKSFQLLSPASFWLLRESGIGSCFDDSDERSRLQISKLKITNKF